MPPPLFTLLLLSLLLCLLLLLCCWKAQSRRTILLTMPKSFWTMIPPLLKVDWWDLPNLMCLTHLLHSNLPSSFPPDNLTRQGPPPRKRPRTRTTPTMTTPTRRTNGRAGELRQQTLDTMEFPSHSSRNTARRRLTTPLSGTPSTTPRKSAPSSTFGGSSSTETDRPPPFPSSSPTRSESSNNLETTSKISSPSYSHTPTSPRSPSSKTSGPWYFNPETFATTSTVIEIEWISWWNTMIEYSSPPSSTWRTTISIGGLATCSTKLDSDLIPGTEIRGPSRMENGKTLARRSLRKYLETTPVTKKKSTR